MRITMKSYGTRTQQIKKAVDNEWQTKETEYFEKCKNDVVPQILAVCMFTLKTRFGFGKKRINDFYTDISATLKLMLEGGVFGKNFSTQDLIDMIKNDYGIDLDSEVRKNDSKC
jgi:hypothetical protein